MAAPMEGVDVRNDIAILESLADVPDLGPW